MYFLLFFVGGIVISTAEGLPLSTCLYETASAVGTVGLTLGITPQLGVLSQLILIVLMYLGRVGGLTLIYAAVSNKIIVEQSCRSKNHSRIKELLYYENILLIGLGRFGRHIALQLNKLGHEVMAVDINEERVNESLTIVTNAQIGDSTNTEFLRSLGIGNFDVCIVTIGGNFQNSLETTSLLKELGAKLVVSRAERDVQENSFCGTERTRSFTRKTGSKLGCYSVHRRPHSGLH